MTVSVDLFLLYGKVTLVELAAAGVSDFDAIAACHPLAVLAAVFSRWNFAASVPAASLLAADYSPIKLRDAGISLALEAALLTLPTMVVAHGGGTWWHCGGGRPPH